MLRFIDSPHPKNDPFPKSLYQVIELSGRVIGEMYVHDFSPKQFHACVHLAEGGDAVMQAHANTRTGAVMQAFMNFRARQGELRDLINVLQTDLDQVIVMEADPVLVAANPITDGKPPF